jgi:predicted transcriptional regulator
LGSDSIISLKILLSIIKGNSTVTDIREDTGLHAKTLSKYLPALTAKKLIELQSKDWKRGKSKHFSLTAKGINWLNNPLNDLLQEISDAVAQLSNPQFRQKYNQAKQEHYQENTRIIQNYFVERALRGDKSFNPPDFENVAFEEPFRESLKKLLTLHLYLANIDNQTPKEIEGLIENNTTIFGPGMRFDFVLPKGKFPECEYAIYETERRLMQQSNNSASQYKSKETHLMGLDFADETSFEKYLKAKTLAERRKAMKRIESEVGWDVSVYTRKLFSGRQKDIDKYLDKTERPYLYAFLALFSDKKTTSKYPQTNSSL